jgi:DNA-directed RNA polymerase subunit omega
MKKIALDDLVKMSESRYSLVTIVSKRARQIVDGSPPLIETDTTKPLAIAIEEFYERKYEAIYDYEQYQKEHPETLKKTEKTEKTEEDSEDEDSENSKNLKNSEAPENHESEDAENSENSENSEKPENLGTATEAHDFEEKSNDEEKNARDAEKEKPDE